MKIAVTGPIDGNIENTYKRVPKDVNWMLCTGEFGIWPDPKRIDRATRLKGNKQEFARLYINGWIVPIPTIFVAGVHEDHRWLDEQKKFPEGLQILDNLHWLMNGYKTIIGDAEKEIRVTGLGKVYSEATFNGRWNKKSHRHYTRRELERGCSSGPTDILLLHENPMNPSNPVRNLIYATRPKLIFHSSKELIVEEIQGITVVGVPKGHIEEINITF